MVTPESDCGLMFKTIDATLETMANAFLNSHGVTLSQIRYLEYLEEVGGASSLKDLERMFEVSQPTVAGIVKRLEHKGFISVERNEIDRRAKIACLSGKGRELLNSLEKSRLTMEDIILEPLDAEERNAFKDCLARVCSNLLERKRYRPRIMCTGTSGRGAHLLNPILGCPITYTQPRCLPSPTCGKNDIRRRLS